MGPTKPTPLTHGPEPYRRPTALLGTSGHHARLRWADGQELELDVRALYNQQRARYPELPLWRPTYLRQLRLHPHGALYIQGLTFTREAHGRSLTLEVAFPPDTVFAASYPPRTPVAQLLKRARERAGLSQAQLAERLGVRPSSVSNLETGQRADPTLATLTAWAQATNAQFVLRPDGELELG